MSRTLLVATLLLMGVAVLGCDTAPPVAVAESPALEIWANGGLVVSAQGAEAAALLQALPAAARAALRGGKEFASSDPQVIAGIRAAIFETTKSSVQYELTQTTWGDIKARHSG